MSSKVNLEEIRKIPQDEFKEILRSWMNQKEITKTLQKKLRNQLVKNFQKTEIAKQLDNEKQNNFFNSKDYAVDTLQAEHLYNQNNHFTLSIFITETRHTALLPNFEKENTFRFEKNEIQELIDMLGITKTDKITRRILNTYENSNDSLLNVVLKELVKSHNSTETRNFATQTETFEPSPPQDTSIISSKSKRSKRKNHGLVSQEFKQRKPKKLKEVAVIAHNLEKMSCNISQISKKLDDFKRDPCQDDSKSIIGHVGQIMTTLNGCVGNFESLCRDIKKINESRNRNYEEWMDDLKNSENGRKFLKKLQKSFTRVVNDEKAKIEKDYRRKLEREKSKLSKLYRLKNSEPPHDDFFNAIGKEINEIFQNTCVEIINIEKESELLEKSLGMRPNKAKKNDVEAKKDPPKVNLNLNECQRIYSDGSSSIKSGSRSSSESFDSDKNN